MRTIFRTLLKRFGGSSQHNNSIFLMASQGVLTVFGYLFWIFVAHLYKSEVVGIAGTLISVATLISQISILGLNNALVRFLPGSTQKNEKITTCLWLVVGASLLISGIYIAAMPVFSPKLTFILRDPLFLFTFVAAMVLSTINTFTDSVFLANRATKYNVIIYTAYSVARTGLPFVLVGMGALGIFAAHVAGVAMAVVMSFYYMIRKLDYRPSLTFSRAIVRQIGGYSLANYIAGFLWGMPLLVAPLVVVNHLGASPAAYFYMVMMIVNVLLIIPTASTQALFAEGSHQAEAKLWPIVRKSLIFAFSLEALGIAAALLGGKYAIAIFGREYASGAGLLYVLAVSVLLVIINMTVNVVVKLRRQNGRLIVINALGAAATIGLFFVFLPHGLIGIGIGYLVGQLLQAAAAPLVLLPATAHRKTGKFLWKRLVVGKQPA